jgi:hypothetical protein
MSTNIYLITIGLFFGTVLAVFAMRALSAAYAARARIASDQAYQALAERAVAAQVETQAALGAIQADVARLAAGLAAVESILKQVE